MITGRNEVPGRTWETRSQVVAAERGREFTFEVNNGWVRWSYTFAPVDGGTELTETWNFLPRGIAGFHERYGDDAENQIEIRSNRGKPGHPRDPRRDQESRRVRLTGPDRPDRPGPWPGRSVLAHARPSVDEGAGEVREVMAGGVGDVAQRPLPGEYGQSVHHGPDGVFDAVAALPAEHAGVDQFVERGAQVPQRGASWPVPPSAAP